MKKIVFLAAMAIVTLASCKKEYIREPEVANTVFVDTTYSGYNGGGNNNGGWQYSPTKPIMTGNTFSWSLSNSTIDPTGKVVYIAWVSSVGLCYNKVTDGVAGVFSPGTVSGGMVSFSLDPSYKRVKFNLSVNGGPPSNRWYWFTAQGEAVQYPCQHMGQNGWCTDDGLNNIFDYIYLGSNIWGAGSPC